jgi:D-3-phosphoglycerate dehydrogenase
VAICHKNIAGMITQFSKIFSDEGVNISDMTNKSKGAYAYTLIDLQSPTTEDMVKELSGVEGVLRVRVIK